MIIVSMALLGVVCLILGVFDAIFRDKDNWVGFVVRSLTSLFLAIYALITINLLSTFNAFSLFIAIAMMINLFYTSATKSKIENDQAKKLVCGISESLVYLAIGLGIISLAPFNIFALVGGLLLGGAIALLILAIQVKKKNNVADVITTILIFVSLGFVLGFGINAIVNTKHLISAIISIIAGVLLLTSNLLNEFLKEGKLKQILCTILQNLVFIALVVSIYLY